jgi:glycosyltransferase involved in cell wall biosynthesis
MTVLVAQLGSRMNYAVPRILHQAGHLERLFTDSCSSKGWPRSLALIPPSVRPEGVRRLLGRRPDGIPPSAITAFQYLGWRYARRRASARSASDLTEAFLWANRAFGNRVCRRDWGQARGVYAFNCAGLEILQRARDRGLFTILEQCSNPCSVEERLLRRERKDFPGWESEVESPGSADFAARETAEWSLADLIVCPSSFVRQAISDCGGPAHRCVIVPYGVDGPVRVPARNQRDGLLRVLTVGAVSLRKGSQYVLNAAQTLAGKAQFRMVGAVELQPAATATLRAHVEVTGLVPRDELGRHYAGADVFLLPSLYEGSATVIYDALAHALPVIATANAGSVVRDGIEGFIIPVRDAEAIVNRLESLASDRDLLDKLSQQALRRASDFTLTAYGNRLLEALALPKLASADRCATSRRG